jgi:hypothetical protein
MEGLMAQSIADIYNALCTSKASMQELQEWVVDPNNPNFTLDNAETLLQSLTSNSKVSIWRLWLWVFAAASWIIQTLFDTHKSEINTILAADRPHTLGWYAEQSKLFQYGYKMIWQNGIFSYSMIDPSAQVVKYAAASESNGQVLLKVATSVNGVVGPLPSVQLAAFILFWSKWKDAGVKISIVSQPADIVKITMTIIRDRLVLAANNSLLTDSSVFPVNDAINAFGDNLQFGGIFRISKLLDAIQAAPGVVDVKIYSAQIKTYNGSYVPVDLYAIPVSGYISLDWVASSITYIDAVNVQVQS